MRNEFDDIRPYYDSELPASMCRIANNPLFAIIASYLFPEEPVAALCEKLLSLKSVYEFQTQIMQRVNDRITEKTISHFSYGGFDVIDRNKAYLFVANHRDIMLDAALLQNIMMKNDVPTSQITFGANLMTSEIVVDIGRSNKMFRVERPSSDIRKFYYASEHLSKYIRHTLVEQNESVWIAQRNGRTKDGLDRTDRGVINMFRMSCQDDKVRSIAELNILPVTVSYEWEPCDIQKACEIYATRRGPYQKSADEDLKSILSGITSHKGRVHFEFSQPITAEELAQFAEYPSQKFNVAVAALVDSRICSAYRLWPNNYIAHDMLSGTDAYASEYSAEEKLRFVEHLERCESTLPEEYDREEIREIMLGIYANAVDSKNIFVAR